MVLILFGPEQGLPIATMRAIRILICALNRLRHALTAFFNFINFSPVCAATDGRSRKVFLKSTHWSQNLPAFFPGQDIPERGC